MNVKDRLARAAPLSRPRGRHTTDRVPIAFARDDAGLEYYDGVLVGAQAIGTRALDPEVRARSAEFLRSVEGDDYMDYVAGFVQAGHERGGADWRFADIVTALYATTELLRPTSYLEIGVRRGRSMAIVAGLANEVAITGVDMWVQEYAGMENPGPDHVRRQLAAVGHTGPLELLSGNSHQVLPRLFRDRPELSFDLITVDGDHSVRGAAQDLATVLPRLRIGGAIVFDDMRHPYHPALHDVWHRVVARDRRYISWQFDDAGYGVAVAVRRW